MLARQGAVYHFRRKVPPRLRSLIGRREIWASLHTVKATTARARAGIVYAAVERVFAMAEKITEGGGAADFVVLPGETPEQALIRLQAADLADAVAIIDQQQKSIDSLQRLAELRVLDAELCRVREVAELADDGIKTMNRVSSVIDRLGGHLAEARRVADIAVQGGAHRQPPAPNASELIAPYFAAKEKKKKSLHQVINQDKRTIGLFLEISGDKPVNLYTRKDVSDFLDGMRRMPAKYGRSPSDKKLTYKQLVERADKNNEPRLKEKTLKRHTSALTQFFSYAVDQNYITRTDFINTVSGFSFATEKGAKEQRDAWTPDDLRALLSSPVWSGCASERLRSRPGRLIIRDSKFWLPLLAMYQGARLEELSDLYRRDIIQDGDIWAIDIKQFEEDGHIRHLKTSNSPRIIAIHPKLIELGFLKYVAKIAPGPKSPIFPDIAPQGADGKRGPRFTRWFVNYRKIIGIYKPGVAAHSFRHTVETRLRNSLSNEGTLGFQQERHLNYILGHSPGTGEGALRYDKGPGLQAAARTLALLAYPEIEDLLTRLAA